ncbi:MAG TPA: hypothetical protein VG650_13490 [Mycobacteriales bacterium]|nr:hypothetical protein [Mycobacteriales bacterium]
MTVDVLPDGLTPGQLAMELLAIFSDSLMPHPDVAAVWQDFCGLLEVDGCLDGLSDHDLRGVMVSVLYLWLSAEDFEQALLNKATWVETTKEGGEPCDDPEAVATGIRAVVALMRTRF